MAGGGAGAGTRGGTEKACTLLSGKIGGGMGAWSIAAGMGWGRTHSRDVFWVGGAISMDKELS